MKGEKELVNLKIQKIKLIFALVLLFILSLGGLKFVKTENEEKISSDGEKKVVRIGLPGISNTILEAGGVAIGNKYFEEELSKEGYKVEYIYFQQAGPALNEAFAANKIDIAMYGDLPITVLKSRGINIKVFSHPRTVMGEDKLANKCGQVGFFGHFHPLGNMTDDDTCAFLIGQALVWVNAHLVFGEKRGCLHLPNVVIKRAGTHQQAVCPNAVGNLGSKVGHGDGMLERAWSHLAHLPEQAFVGVGEFEKRHTRSETEGAFDNIHQRISQQQQHTVGHEVAIHARLKVGDVACLHQLQRKEHQEVGQGHEQRTFEQLCPTRQVAQRINGHQATD